MAVARAVPRARCPVAERAGRAAGGGGGAAEGAAPARTYRGPAPGAGASLTPHTGCRGGLSGEPL